MSMCRVVSCVIGRGCLLWPVRSLSITVSLCPASFCTPRPNLPVTPGVSWLPTFAFQSPMIKRTSFFLVWVLEGLVGCHRTVQFGISDWGIDLDYCDIEWFALETNRDHSVIFEIASKYCILDSLLTMRATPFLLRDSCQQRTSNCHLYFVSIVVALSISSKCFNKGNYWNMKVN